MIVSWQSILENGHRKRPLFFVFFVLFWYSLFVIWYLFIKTQSPLSQWIKIGYCPYRGLVEYKIVEYGRGGMGLVEGGVEYVRYCPKPYNRVQWVLGVLDISNVVQMDVQVSSTVVIIYCDYSRTDDFHTAQLRSQMCAQDRFDSCLRLENYF